MSRTLFTRDSAEPVDTLGDATPGAFDPLPMLQHPAIQQADEDLRLPAWVLALAPALVAVVVVVSSFFPWGFAPALP